MEEGKAEIKENIKDEQEINNKENNDSKYLINRNTLLNEKIESKKNFKKKYWLKKYVLWIRIKKV